MNTNDVIKFIPVVAEIGRGLLAFLERERTRTGLTEEQIFERAGVTYDQNKQELLKDLQRLTGKGLPAVTDLSAITQEPAAPVRPTSQIPEIGRVVHYNNGGTVRAAIITKVEEPGEPKSKVSLTVFSESGESIFLAVPFSRVNGWSWPGFSLA